VFVGYHDLHADSQVVALLQEGDLQDSAHEGDNVQIILTTTPFYAEGGGQVGDAGVLEWSGGKAFISTTTKTQQGLFVHHARIMRGTLAPAQAVTARVDPARVETEKHHSATHLLHAALRSVLGEHVAQAGSLVTPERLRFDFSHGEAITTAQIRHVETLVNRWIQADFAVNWQVVPIAEARRSGAMMLFGEKYGENVRMVRMDRASHPAMAGDQAVSIELCGGTHVRRTGEIGSLFVVSEEAVSAGVRRIEAVTGMAAARFASDLRDTTYALAKDLGSKPDELPNRISKLQEDLKGLHKQNSQLRDKLAAAQTSGGAASEVHEAAGVRYVTMVLEGLDNAALRNAADTTLNKQNVDMVVLASGQQLVVKVSSEAQAKGVHAGNLIREIAKRAGGGGGGRPDMAQAGIKDSSKLPDALAAIAGLLEA
jgi:alanyl-tRNA synthetase